MSDLLGPFQIGVGNSYLTQPAPPPMTPRLLIRALPAQLMRGPANDSATVNVSTIVFLEPQLGFTGAVTLSADIPSNIASRITSVSFNPSSTSSSATTANISISPNAENGLYIVQVLATTPAGIIFRGELLITVVPTAFCVINGVAIPVTEDGFSESSEVLGDSARARDGTLMSTRRGYKRTWRIKTEPLDAITYAQMGNLLFAPDSFGGRWVMTGQICSYSPVIVLITPEQPDVFKANGQLFYRLAAQVEEM